MITNFTEYTSEMSEDEKKLVPILINGFSKRTKDNPIKAPEIVKRINEVKDKYGIKAISEPRLRKICNMIRSKGILPLIATSNGYYCSYDKQEIMEQIKSLQERADAIINSANGLKKFL
jgi:hypothetical protein